MRRRRDLTREEAQLWREVARSVVPLAGKSVEAVPAEPPAPAPTPPGETRKPPRAARTPRLAAPSPALAPPPPLKPLAPLEMRVARAISRGRRRPDAVLDLHGLTQAEAHRRLIAFLRGAQASGHGLVTVITGQGGGLDAQGGERGILRRVVPQWLGLPDLRTIVLGYATAGPRQGGAGALHVRIRKRS